MFQNHPASLVQQRLSQLLFHPILGLARLVSLPGKIIELNGGAIRCHV